MKTHVVQTNELVKVIYFLEDEIEVVTQFSVRNTGGIAYNMQVLSGGKMIFFSDNPANLPRWLEGE